MLSKQNYVALARILNYGSNPGNNEYADGVNAARRHITLEIAKYLASDNPVFNRGLFLAACGLEGYEND